MQPAIAIPPYDEEKVKRLVGLRCAVPVLSNPAKRWWVTIKSVHFIHQRCVLCKVAADHPRFGKERWVALDECQWRGQKTEPLFVAIFKARQTTKDL
jgi:hypothetical protein